MIRCYFGVPGVGKNTLLTKIARKSLYKRKGLLGGKRYDDVYSTFACEGCKQIDFTVLKEYKIYNSLILFDEMTLDADNRDFKNFSKEVRDFLVLHRHLGNDIYYATQNYQNVDKKIRDLTDELWYLSKSVVPIAREFTVAQRIYRNVAINEYTSDLVLGYRFCNLLERLFVRNYEIVFRRLYYRFFDSWEEGSLKDRPLYNAPYWKVEHKKKNISIVDYLNKTCKQVLSRSQTFSETLTKRKKPKE